jgi:hypothetical protein
MKRYRVEFFINKVCVATFYCNGWTRHDAKTDAEQTEEFQRVEELAKKKSATIFWDATVISECSNDD